MRRRSGCFRAVLNSAVKEEEMGMEPALSIETLDWNQLWKQDRGGDRRKDDREFWDRRAPSFAKVAGADTYAETFLRILNPEPDWNVLDVGCAAGTLAVPLAARVRSITALDFSPVMIDLLSARCRDAGIANVAPRVASWEDDWRALGLSTHDIAIASRSLAVDDLQAALTKLNSFARKRVCISCPVGSGPFDRRVFEAVGRECKPSPDYIYTYNLLYQMGIYANVSFVAKPIRKSFANEEEAFESLSWMLDEMSGTEESRLRQFVAEHLIPDGGRWTMDYERQVRWAIMWWDKEIA